MATSKSKPPKLTTRSNSCEGDPLDKLTLTINKHGTAQVVPALHRGWADRRVFGCYEPPPKGPHAESNSLILPDLQKAWVDKITFFLEDLKWLLHLPHHRFWSQIVYDPGVHDCLDSFLSQAPRYFDPAEVQLTDKMKETLQESFRRVFAVYLRMGTYKESKSYHITPQVFGEIIYDNFVFDIPKVMDLCVLYCQGNSSLLCRLIDNIFKYQPKYHDDLAESVPTVFQSFDNVQSHLGLETDCGDGNVKLAATNPSRLSQFSHLSWSELKDIMLFLLDISTTLGAFLDVYPPACEVFHKQGLLLRMASFYDVVIPAAQSELSFRADGSESNDEAKLETEGMFRNLMLIKSCLLKIFHSVISTCCFQPILDCASSDNALVYVEDFFQVLTAILSERHFVCDYQKKYPLEDSIEMISQTGIELDITRLEYIINGIAAITGKNISGAIESIMGTLHNGINVSSKSTVDVFSNNWDSEDLNSGACAGPALNGIELESLITQVKDLLPDLGDGFIEICLEYYNFKTEAVINALLEDSLPEVLRQLDRMTTRKVTPKVPANSAVSESKPNNADLPLSTVLSHRANIFDDDEFDVFNRLTLDESRVHKGKKLTSSKKLIDERSESHRETLKNVYEKYNVVVDEVFGEAGDLYNDEYDDTYDEQTVGASEPKMETDELLSRRPFVVPRALENFKSNRNRFVEEYESESDGEKGDEKPRDCFVQNPEEVRQRYEAARQMKFQNRRGRGGPPRNAEVKGQAKGQGQSDNVLHNRANKERNKSARGNHNRRMMADRKRSRGMIPS